MEQSSGCSKNSIISELYQNSRVNYLINIKGPKGMSDDFKHELFLFLAEMDEVKLCELFKKNELIWYVCRVILNMASQTGKFHYKYRDLDFSEYFLSVKNEGLKSVDVNACRELLRAMEQAAGESLEKFHEVLIFRQYVEFNSCDAVARYFDLPYHYVNRVVKKLKNEYKSFIRNYH